MNSPRYPTLTKKGFLTQRGHDLNPKLIEFINEIIAQMPHGLPINSQTRGQYYHDLAMETYEDQEGATISSLLKQDEVELRSFLYECTKDSPLRVITRLNPEDANKPMVYLERYPILEHEELMVYIHFFRMSDEPHLHTHPWKSSYSTILSGGYTETRLKDMTLIPEGKGFTQKHRTAGSFGSLDHLTQHFVTLDKDELGQDKACWTLFMHHREWDYGWFFTENEPVEAQVWDDLADNGKGAIKTVPSTLLVPKEKGGGANKKDWWTMKQGPTTFIDRAHIIRERYGLTKESYL